MRARTVTDIKSIAPGTKVLFANFPADGHFNPMTGLAKHLLDKGCDVRWYTSTIYEAKVQKLGIPFYPLQKALDISGENLGEVFPQRDAIKSQIAKLNFDLVNVFILRGPEYFQDIQEIYKEFAFDIMVADVAFTAVPLVKECMQIPVVTIGIMPLPETSKDLAPMGLGMTPSYSFFGKLKQAGLRFFADQVLFKKSYNVMKDTLAKYGVEPDGNVFDTLIRKSDLLLQSGSPGFEYYRSDLNPKVRFIGALLPYSSSRKTTPWFDGRLLNYKKVIVVTQGTVEKDVNKILVPVLEAFKGTDVLVVATTGGSGTKELRTKYEQDNVIIEDFIPFNDIMPYAHAYITNGGYGGVMLGIQHALPLVVAGVHEGKNEINARIGYFKFGVNLQTESPKPEQVKKAVNEVLANPLYKENVQKLKEELQTYQPGELTEHYIAEVVEKTKVRVAKVVLENEPEPIY